MKKIKTLVFTFLLLFFSANLVQAMSLDEIYRDVVRSDNRGYLPMFVKNRTAPDFLDEEVVLKDVPEPKPEDTSPVNPDLEIVNWKTRGESTRPNFVRSWQNGRRCWTMSVPGK